MFVIYLLFNYNKYNKFDMLSKVPIMMPLTLRLGGDTSIVESLDTDF